MCKRNIGWLPLTGLSECLVKSACEVAWAGVAQLVGVLFIHQKVGGSVPSQDISQNCRFNLWPRHV